MNYEIAFKTLVKTLNDAVTAAENKKQLGILTSTVKDALALCPTEIAEPVLIVSNPMLSRITELEYNVERLTHRLSTLECMRFNSF